MCTSCCMRVQNQTLNPFLNSRFNSHSLNLISSSNTIMPKLKCCSRLISLILCIRVSIQNWILFIKAPYIIIISLMHLPLRWRGFYNKCLFKRLPKGVFKEIMLFVVYNSMFTCLFVSFIFAYTLKLWNINIVYL